MKTGKQKVLTMRPVDALCSGMTPHYSLTLVGQLMVIHGFDHDKVWAKARKMITAGWELVSSEYTQLEHRRTKRRGVFTELTLSI